MTRWMRENMPLTVAAWQRLVASVKELWSLRRDWFYPGGFRGWLNDWRLGWSEDDLHSALAKVKVGRDQPGTIVWLTHREMAAIKDAQRVYAERMP
jgi:hypothetical protein